MISKLFCPTFSEISKQDAALQNHDFKICRDFDGVEDIVYFLVSLIINQCNMLIIFKSSDYFTKNELKISYKFWEFMMR